VNRHKERASYDYDTVHAIVNQSSILRVSFLPTAVEIDPFPTILPMLGNVASFSSPGINSKPLDLYLHGHAASRLMKLPSSPRGHSRRLASLCGSNNL